MPILKYDEYLYYYGRIIVVLITTVSFYLVTDKSGVCNSRGISVDDHHHYSLEGKCI